MALIVDPPEPIPTHPDGKTCCACIHFKRCSWLLSYDGTETACDWIPSKFREKAPICALEEG